MKAFFKLILQILVAILLIGSALLLAYKLIKGKPPTEGKQAKVAMPYVEADTFLRKTHATKVESFGTIKVYDESVIASQVSGRITELNDTFRVGNLVKKGTVIAQIEQSDFKTILANQLASVASAEQVLAEENVRSQQAKDDWMLSGRDIDKASDFVLRKPQLVAAEAKLQSAHEAVKKARLDLNRTTIKAPFDGVVLSRKTTSGRFVSPQTTIGEMASTDKAEVRIPLTATQKIRLIGKQLPIDITLLDPQRPDSSWKATITRLDPSVDPKNQVSYSIAEVNSPYSENPAERLAIGTFVTAHIPSSDIPNAFALPESALINDQFVWTVQQDETSKKSTLKKVKAKRIYSKEGVSYCTLESDDQKIKVITRPLTSFIDNMEVRIKGEQPAKKPKMKPSIKQ